MIKKHILTYFIILLSLFWVANSFNPSFADRAIPCSTRISPCPMSISSEPIENIDFEKFKNARIIYFNLNYQTDNPLSKASLLRKKLSQYPDIEIESLSFSDSSGSIRAYLSKKTSDEVVNSLIDDPELSNFSKSASDVGNSYYDYARYYFSYKAILDNFDSIYKIIKNSSPYIDYNKLKRTFEDQVNSYQSSIKSYERQVDRDQLQINISKIEDKKP